MSKRIIYVVSDSLGETGEQLLRVALTQFPKEMYDLRRFIYVENQVDMDNILRKAKAESALIFYTLVQYEWRRYLDERAVEMGVSVFDLMGPLLHSLGIFLEEAPVEIPGVQYRMDSNYFQRMDAIEFAVRYDDGKDPRGVLRADVVLLGISRTSKTPLSMYLAGQRLKVANVPLLMEVPLPEEVYQIERSKIFGLTNEPEELLRIRKERLRQMGFSGRGNYADPKRVLEEIEYAEKIFRDLRIPVINVSGLAVEETASIILRILTKGAGID